MDAKICDTPITGNFLAENLKKSLGPKAVLKSIKDAKQIAAGQGYVSVILRLELEWENDDDGLPKTVIFKVPIVESLHKLMETMDHGDQADKMKGLMAKLVTEVHNCECDIYGLMGPKPPILMPKCFLALPVLEETPGAIVLEDLSDKAAIPPSFIAGLTYKQLLAVVKEVARLHAWSLTTTVDWKSKVVKVEDREQVMRQFLAPLLPGIKTSIEQYPTEFGGIDIDKVGKYLTYEAYEQTAVGHRDVTDDVLAHGDCHMMNMMFNKMPDGTVGDDLIALIDFQVAMQASPAFDIGRLMAVSVDHKIRREHTNDILRQYFDEVKSIAGDKFRATFDQYKHLYEQVFATTAVTLIASIPMMNHVMVKSEGEQKIKDQKAILERVKENYEDAAKILGI